MPLPAATTVLLAALVLALAGTSAGCSKIPGMYRLDIQQGNVITQEQVSQLRHGMDKRKVRFVLGTPLITDSFNPDRWDYVYTFQKGGGKRVERHVSLFFENDKLTRVKGDVTPAEGMPVIPQKQEAVVTVPDPPPVGIFGRLASIFHRD